jgi:peptidoglycan/LPS O-acetylase OafA/YrhL
VNSRNQSLDVLRGIAVLLVLGDHFPYYRAREKIGWTGVDLFFVLSGFLISGLLFREYQHSGSINFKVFVIRRAFKIWPLYVFLLVLTAVTIKQFPIQGMLPAALFYSNYVSPAALPGVLAPTWSLIEVNSRNQSLDVLLGL